MLKVSTSVTSSLIHNPLWLCTEVKLPSKILWTWLYSKEPDPEEALVEHKSAKENPHKCERLKG